MKISKKQKTWEQNMKKIRSPKKATWEHNLNKSNSAKTSEKISLKEKLSQKKEKREKKVKLPRSARKTILKNVLIVVLAVVIVVESVALVAVGIKGNSAPASTTPGDIVLNLSLDTTADEINSAVASLISKVSEQGITTDDIVNTVKDVVYSDAIVNTVASIAYPLLFDTLTNLGLMEFATKIDLYPTGPLLAEQLEGTEYTCCDKDGTRKNLIQVLNNVGSDWSYMDSEVTWVDSDGTTKTTTLWNSIKWNVTDKETFYKVMGDMSAGIRGVLEVCIQDKSRVVNINVVEYLLNTDFLNMNLDAATIYNASEKSGYESCLITLFNALGLKDGEYPTISEVAAYTELSDVWEAILEPVLFAVEKIANDPVSGLTSLLINFADIIESGTLCESIRTLRLDGDFHELATSVMGFEDGIIFNLGESLIEIICDMGIDISGSFNNLLDSLFALITKAENADMPDMDVNTIRSCATKTTLSNGNAYYVADSQQTIDFLVGYIVNEKIIESVINLTSLKGTQEAQTIIDAIGQSKEGLTTIAKTLVGLLLEKLNEIA